MLRACLNAEAGEYVFVREVEGDVTKRSDVALPDVLRVEFERNGRKVQLDLTRNERVSINAPVSFAGEAKRELVPDLKVGPTLTSSNDSLISSCPIDYTESV